MEWGLAAIGGVLGAVFGSFAATSALRMAEGRDPIKGRSACDGCHKALTWAETVPIAGGLIAKGRCATCQHPINPFHLVGEGLGAYILGGSLAMFDWPHAPIVGALGLILLLQSLIDLKTYRLPDVGNAIVAVLCAIMAWLNGALIIGVIAAAVSWLVLSGLRYVMKRRRGQDMLGGGDIKLICALAVFAGEATPYLVAGAAVLALTWALLKPGARSKKLPFGPAIALAGIGTVFILAAGR